MAPTRTIAGILGPTILAMGFSLLTRPGAFAEVAASLEANLAVVYVIGVIVFAVGVAIVRVHNVWSFRPPLIVTVIGWLSIVAGLLRLLFPQAIAARTIGLGQEPALLMALGAATLVLGGYLTVLSFPQRSGVSAAE